MSVIVPTVSEWIGDREGSAKKITWGPMANGDTGAPIAFPEYYDRSVQLKGTLGAAGNCRIEGSNDLGVTYAALNDRNNNALNMAAAGLKAVNEGAELMRPNITAGDGTTSLTVVMTIRRDNTPRT